MLLLLSVSLRLLSFIIDWIDARRSCSLILGAASKDEIELEFVDAAWSPSPVESSPMLSSLDGAVRDDVAVVDSSAGFVDMLISERM